MIVEFYQADPSESKHVNEYFVSDVSIYTGSESMSILIKKIANPQYGRSILNREGNHTT